MTPPFRTTPVSTTAAWLAALAGRTELDDAEMRQRETFAAVMDRYTKEPKP